MRSKSSGLGRWEPFSHFLTAGRLTSNPAAFSLWQNSDGPQPRLSTNSRSRIAKRTSKRFDRWSSGFLGRGDMRQIVVVCVIFFNQVIGGRTQSALTGFMVVNGEQPGIRHCDFIRRGG